MRDPFEPSPEETAQAHAFFESTAPDMRGYLFQVWKGEGRPEGAAITVDVGATPNERLLLWADAFRSVRPSITWNTTRHWRVPKRRLGPSRKRRGKTWLQRRARRITRIHRK